MPEIGIKLTKADDRLSVVSIASATRGNSLRNESNQ